MEQKNKLDKAFMDLKNSTNTTTTCTSIYDKFLGFLVKKGNRHSAKKSLDQTFSLVSNKTQVSNNSVLITLFRNLNSFVEVKKVRVRRRFVLVPFPVRCKRRSYLVLKWIMQSARKNKAKVPFSRKLAIELLTTLKGSLSRTKQLRQLNFSTALANRSNTHFRW